MIILNSVHYEIRFLKKSVIIPILFLLILIKNYISLTALNLNDFILSSNEDFKKPVNRNETTILVE